MKAVILAAGDGKRLRLGYPKCLIQVDGKSVLDTLISELRGLQIQDISVVVGFDYKKIKSQSVKYYMNEIWYNTEEFYSLYTANNEFNDDLLVICGDTIVSKIDLKTISKAKKDIAILCTKEGSFGGVVKLNKVVCADLKTAKYNYKQGLQEAIAGIISGGEFEVVSIQAKNKIYNLDTVQDLKAVRDLHTVVL